LRFFRCLGFSGFVLGAGKQRIKGLYKLKSRRRKSSFTQGQLYFSDERGYTVSWFRAEGKKGKSIAQRCLGYYYPRI